MKSCPWCGIPITTGTTCVSHRSTEAQAARPSPDTHAAPGRPWRDNRGIVRWVIDGEPNERACLTCQAEPWQRCVTANGKERSDHAERIIARRCKCGDDLRKPKATMCQTCADESRAEFTAAYRERKRSAA